MSILQRTVKSLAAMMPALIGTCVGACTQATQTEETPAETEAALGSAFGYNSDGTDADGRWTTPWASPGIVNVCFVQPSPVLPTTNNTPSAVMSVLADSWASATGLTFVNQGTCPSPAPTAWLSIYLEDHGSNGVSYGGVGSRLPADAKWEYRTDIETWFGDRGTEYRRQAAHELGHALGFYHEMDRGSCTSGSGGNTHGLLTAFDQQSIMDFSYCTIERTETDLLSPLDRLGAEMMYPKKLSEYAVACNDRCFETSEGTIVREDGSMTIDWVKRGGDVDPIWYVGSNTYQPSDGILTATNLSSGATSVTMTFPDAFGNANFSLNIPAPEQRSLLTGGGTVVKSNSAHTAIVHAIQTML